MKHFIISRARN